MMRKLLLASTILATCVLGGATHSAHAGVCPPSGNTICNQLPAVNLQSTDLVEVWQFDQTPGTRQVPISSLGGGGGGGGGGDAIFNSLVMQSKTFLNINDGSPNYAYLGAPPDAGYPPSGMQLAGSMAIVNFPYGEDALAINLLLLSNTTSQFQGAWGSFIAGGVQQLAVYPTSDVIGEANEVDPSPPLMTLQVSAYSGAITLTTTAATMTTDAQPNVLHFGPGNVPRCIIQPVGIVGLNIPTTGAIVGFPNATVIAVDYVAGDVTFSNNVSGTVPVGTVITFGAGRANLTTPLTTTQLSQLRQYMTVETLNPHYTSMVSTWDPNGAWVETIGWTADGNAAFGQIPTSPTLYVGYHNAYFTRNTIVVPCDPVGDPTCDVATANGSIGDEIDVYNIYHHYDDVGNTNGGGISIFAFESTGLSPAADSAIGIAGPFYSAINMAGIAQSGFYVTARNDGGLGQGSTTGQLNWIVSAYDGSQIIGDTDQPTNPCYGMFTDGSATGTHNIDMCGGFGNGGVPYSGFLFLHAGGEEIIGPDQSLNDVASDPTDGNSIFLIPAGAGFAASIQTRGDAAGQIDIVPAGGLAGGGQITLSGQVFIPPTSGTVTGSLCETGAGQVIYKAGVNCF